MSSKVSSPVTEYLSVCKSGPRCYSIPIAIQLVSSVSPESIVCSAGHDLAPHPSVLVVIPSFVPVLLTLNVFLRHRVVLVNLWLYALCPCPTSARVGLPPSQCVIRFRNSWRLLHLNPVYWRTGSSGDCHRTKYVSSSGESTQDKVGAPVTDPVLHRRSLSLLAHIHV